MEDKIWELVVLVVTNLLTGGVIRMMTLKAARRREEAGAAQQEGIAKQELSKARSQEIDNVEDVVKLYKQALEDMRTLSAQEKETMQSVIKRQDEKIADMGKALADSREVINDLKTKIASLTKDMKVLKDSASLTCKTCPQGMTGKCLNPRFRYVDMEFFPG